MKCPLFHIIMDKCIQNFFISFWVHNWNFGSDLKDIIVTHFDLYSGTFLRYNSCIWISNKHEKKIHVFHIILNHQVIELPSIQEKSFMDHFNNSYFEYNIIILDQIWNYFSTSFLICNQQLFYDIVISNRHEEIIIHVFLSILTFHELNHPLFKISHSCIISIILTLNTT